MERPSDSYGEHVGGGRITCYNLPILLHPNKDWNESTLNDPASLWQQNTVRQVDQHFRLLFIRRARLRRTDHKRVRNPKMKDALQLPHSLRIQPAKKILEAIWNNPASLVSGSKINTQSR
jgi:hypothetical protein